MAYEKLTGKVKWTTPSLGPVGYVSPAIVKVGGDSHVVMITASSRGGYGESGSGGSILADGLLLSTDGRSKLYLIEPDPSAFKPIASAELLKEGGTGSANDPLASKVGGSTQKWAPLALVNGRLLIRDQSRLMCVKVAQWFRLNTSFTR